MIHNCLPQNPLSSNQYSCNFVHAKVFFSSEVSRIHGPGQLEIQKGKGRKRKISSTDRTHQGEHQGRERGCSRNSQGRRFSNHRAGNNNHCQTVINGVDVLSPTHNFTSQEWEELHFNGGRDYVTNAKERMNNSAKTNNNGGCGHGHEEHNNGEGGGHNIGAVGNSKNQNDNNSPQNGNDNCCGQNGHGFSYGAYGVHNFHLGC
eukprot:13730996-Ditylum_brightwellii.AAC.1